MIFRPVMHPSSWITYRVLDLLTPPRSSETPGVLHEIREVLIVINWRRDSSIVVIPLDAGNLSIVVFVTEVGKELKESLVLCNFSRDYLGMGSSIVCNSKVWSSNAAWAIDIEFRESDITNFLSSGIGASSNSSKELVEVNITILIGIQMCKKAISFFFAEATSTIVESNKEFLGINSSGSSRVIGVENSSKPSNCFGSPGSKLVFNLSKNWNLNKTGKYFVKLNFSSSN